MQRLLLTGGTGVVGQLLLPRLRSRYRLRIAGLAAPEPGILAPQDEFVSGDLADAGFAQRCAAGSDVVIHLAANASPAASVGEALHNVQMTATLLQAAAESGTGTVVLASSVHATGLDYRDGREAINTSAAPRPCCPYGAGKVAIEGLARLHQAHTGAAVSCLRLGLTGWPLRERQYANTWLSGNDLNSLVAAALARPPGFGIYHAVSADAAAVWDVANARADLGWEPRDRWPVDVASLPPADGCPCLLFG